MFQNPNYMLITINNVPYLQPYGQAIVNLGKSIRINQTGVFLWNQLKEDLSREELLQQMMQEYQILPSRRPSVEKDLDAFLHPLLVSGIIKESSEVKCESGYKLLSIGELSVLLCGNSIYFSELFDPFESKALSGSFGDSTSSISDEAACQNDIEPHKLFDLSSDNNTDYDLIISVHEYHKLPEVNGTLLIHANDLWLFELSDSYHLIFPTMSQKFSAEISKDGTTAHIYMQIPNEQSLKPHSLDTSAGSIEITETSQQSGGIKAMIDKTCIHSNENTDAVSKFNDIAKTYREDIFHIIRFLYLYTAQKHGIYAIHSASLLYKNKAWLFSGHSGMGKSTHTNLWHQYFHSPLINGDLNLITIKNGKPFVYGLPWCGTSGISSTATHDLGGIIFLKQNPIDQLDELSYEEQVIRIAQRLISPTWKSAQLQQCISFASDLAKLIYAPQLRCTKEKSAALTCQMGIDAYLLEHAGFET